MVSIFHEDSSVEEDIEMIGLRHATERSTTDDHSANGHGHYPAKKVSEEHESDDEDDSGVGGEDSHRALLGSTERVRPRRELFNNLRAYWNQVQNIVVESAPTLLLTTISLLFTGKLLEQVSRWRAMREVHQLIMIIPVILNLKGNLEMNLSARLGTAANTNELDDPKVRKSMIFGNLSLLQVQATVVSFVAAVIALLLGRILPFIFPSPESATLANGASEISSAANSTRSLFHPINYAILDPRRPIPHPISPLKPRTGIPTLIMVASTSMTAACLSGVFLGSFMCALIVLCWRFGRDPDNIAPPVASCLGDLITLCFVGLTSSVLILVIDTPIPFVVGILVVISSTTCLILTLRNRHVRPLLSQGWTPLFGAMVISSGTGIVLDRFVSRYEGFAMLAVVISGLPGSVGSIFVSRLSTSLHAAALSISPSTARSLDSKPTPEPSRRLVMMTLLFVTLPVEIIFLSVLHGLGWLHLPFLFVAFSVVFFFCAVFISLVIAQSLTDFLWSKQKDPDMYALPIHSALMDLVGQLLLVICFEIVQTLGARVRMRA